MAHGGGRRFGVVVSAWIALAGLVGCAGDSSGPETPKTFVVFGSLYVDEAVDAENAVFVSRVLPVEERYGWEEAAVSDARVTLGREGEEPASLLLVDPGAYANPAIVVAPLTLYLLEIEIPGEGTLRARTRTPNRIEAKGGPPEGPAQIRHESLQDSFPVLLECADREQVLLADVYCLEDWRDAVYIYPFGGHDKPDDYAEDGGDKGQPRHIFAYFRARHLVREDQGWKIDFYGAMMAFFGRHTLQIASIDENTYNYLYRDYPEENGGIDGGIGLFGSACRRIWTVDVVK